MLDGMVTGEVLVQNMDSIGKSECTVCGKVVLNIESTEIVDTGSVISDKTVCDNVLVNAGLTDMAVTGRALVNTGSTDMAVTGRALVNTGSTDMAVTGEGLTLIMDCAVVIMAPLKLENDVVHMGSSISSDPWRLFIKLSVIKLSSPSNKLSSVVLDIGGGKMDAWLFVFLSLTLSKDSRSKDGMTEVVSGDAATSIFVLDLKSTVSIWSWEKWFVVFPSTISSACWGKSPGLSMILVCVEICLRELKTPASEKKQQIKNKLQNETHARSRFI